MANRVVPSIALPDWSDGKPARLFQHQVLDVDGTPVADAPAVYARVAARPAGTSFAYGVRAPDGTTGVVVVPSRRFGRLDFALLFGAYLLNGWAFVAIGLLVLLLKPESPASAGLFCFSAIIGLFVITAADLYGPATFFRLHVLAEALMGAGALHLALVFPTERLGPRRNVALAAIYASFGVLAAVYEAVLWSPSAYTNAHLVAIAAQGVAAVALIAGIARDYLVSPAALVRRRVGIVAAGALIGFLGPAVLLAASSLLGGSIPLNAAALTAFVFPLSAAYAIVQTDLFEIDVVLRRTVTYAVVVAAIGVLYLTVLLVLGTALPGLSLEPRARLLLAVVNLAVLFVLAPLRSGVQRSVDRVFSRGGYDADEVAAVLSRALARARTLPAVVAATLGSLRQALWPRRLSILLRSADGTFASAPGSDVVLSGVRLPRQLAQRCQRGEILARYEWEDGSGRPVPEIWSVLGAEILVPVRHEDGALALLVLDRKLSGRSYDTLDKTLLGTAAGQIGLALATAEAFGELERLNASLEEQVRSRTGELEGANAGLSVSLGELRHAYARLEQSQASLMRADRLASLGRLAAGIAHEMNTPLSAVMNALQSLGELGREYAESIDDPTVSAGDHREIAAEIIAGTAEAASWARKAATFIRRMKLHVHDARADVVQTFTIASLVDEVRTLLAHRLRASRCVLEIESSPPDLSMTGDPERLGQVLVNLIVNAIDAYEDQGRDDGRVVVQAEEDAELGWVVLRVQDWAGGIAPEHLPRIFDELFTTKEAGRGTGLGLCIARNLVEQTFSGTLRVATSAGVGSCFTATLAARPIAREAAAVSRAEAAAGPAARQGASALRAALP